MWEAGDGGGGVTCFVHGGGGKFVDVQVRVAIRDVIQRRSAGRVGL